MKTIDYIVGGGLGFLGYYATTNIPFAIAVFLSYLVLGSLKFNLVITALGSLLVGFIVVVMLLNQSLNFGGLGYPNIAFNGNSQSPPFTLPPAWSNFTYSPSSTASISFSTSSSTSSFATSSNVCGSQCCGDSDCIRYNGVNYFVCLNGVCEVKSCSLNGDCPTGWHCSSSQCVFGT